MSPTSRTLKHLREQGQTAEVVERFNSFTKRRKDLFNVIDIIAVNSDGITGVQATSRSNVSARVKKSLAEPLLRKWLLGGGKFIVIGWGKTGPRGRRKTFTAVERQITLDDLLPEVDPPVAPMT